MEPDPHRVHPEPSSAGARPSAGAPRPADGGDRADCVLCGEPTEYPAATKGATLCPVCAWQEAERAACGC